MFLVGHFDSFQMFMRVIKRIITYGRQLEFFFFFFLPSVLYGLINPMCGHFVAGESDLYF